MDNTMNAVINVMESIKKDIQGVKPILTSESYLLVQATTKLDVLITLIKGAE